MALSSSTAAAIEKLMQNDPVDPLDEFYAADFFGLKAGDIEMINKACDEFFDKRGMPRGKDLFEIENQKFHCSMTKTKNRKKKNEPNKNKRRKS